MRTREAGQVLGGKYRLVARLGGGGMGSVWRAEHLSLSSPVAIKLIEPATAREPDGLHRFLREARTAAALRSPHVVQIFDYGVDGDTPYIVMELLDGESLAERLNREGCLSVPEVARIVQHIARALARNAASSVTSSAIASAPAGRAAGASPSSTTTCAPQAASRSAQAAPMPLAPPVTTTTSP